MKYRRQESSLFEETLLTQKQLTTQHKWLPSAQRQTVRKKLDSRCAVWQGRAQLAIDDRRKICKLTTYNMSTRLSVFLENILMLLQQHFQVWCAHGPQEVIHSSTSGFFFPSCQCSYWISQNTNYLSKPSTWETRQQILRGDKSEWKNP